VWRGLVFSPTRAPARAWRTFQYAAARTGARLDENPGAATDKTDKTDKTDRTDRTDKTDKTDKVV
jgi:hypothetical protein